MKHSKKRWWILAWAMLAAMPMVAGAQTQQLPIGAWVEGQVESHWWSTWPPDRFLYFDVYGKRAEALGLNLGTSVEGGVTVRKMVDGRAYVSVSVFTRNALCWGTQAVGEKQEPAFGYSPGNVDNGSPASLGDGLFQLQFTMASPDMPLPPASELGTEDYPIIGLSAVINCSGQLRSGSGFPDGTPGNAHVTQKGMLANGFPGHCPALDCWPAEFVRFWPTGKK
jgi:hypothetical protein